MLLLKSASPRMKKGKKNMKEENTVYIQFSSHTGVGWREKKLWCGGELGFGIYLYTLIRWVYSVPWLLLAWVDGAVSSECAKERGVRERPVAGICMQIYTHWWCLTETNVYTFFSLSRLSSNTYTHTQKA